ncbi:MAG: substrate-binding domain-containing protein [Bacteroidetes bacterium]|nr:substrate-binding domain-containing protein [Bacteroidota bacterium]
MYQKKTGNIGFILTDDHFLRTEPFYTKIFLGAEFEAREGEYYILLTTVKADFTASDPLPRFIRDKSVDGIIIAGKVPPKLIEKLGNNSMPVVVVDYQMENKNYSHILIDNIHGGILATEHLIQNGHKKIGFIGGDINHPSIYERLNGFNKAHERANIIPDNNRIKTNTGYPDRQNGYNLARELFTSNKNITGVFACNDAMAIGVMHYLKDNNYKIPQDVSLVGFDDVEADLLLDPPLTTVRVPKIELGAEAFRVLVSQLKNNKIQPKKILVPVEILVRNSTKKIQ